MDSIDDLFMKLQKSRFRSSFALKEKDVLYIKEKGIEKIESHCKDFVGSRLADVSHVIDGKQTPMRGHPVFVAQHATATCCRECLYKWHKIKKEHILTEKEQEYVVNVIMEWIKNQLKTEK